MRNSVFAATLFTSLASAATAETAFDMTVTLDGTTERQMTVFAQGHMAGTLTSSYDSFNGIAGNPMNGMMGTCTGHVEVQLPAGSGGGLCTFRNDAGDMVVISYDIAGLNREGGLSGSWIAIGGTGKTAGVRGGGSFVNSDAAEDGTFVQAVMGAITLP